VAFGELWVFLCVPHGEAQSLASFSGGIFSSVQSCFSVIISIAGLVTGLSVIDFFSTIWIANNYP